jgi:CBS domain-containing protein
LSRRRRSLGAFEIAVACPDNKLAEGEMIEQSIGHFMKGKKTQQLLSVLPTDAVQQAVAMMSRHGAGSVVIKEKDGTVDGIFTERDLLTRVVEKGLDPKATRVSTVMSPDVRRVAPTATVEEALRLMLLHGHRHLLVAEGTKVDGLVSIRDLMSWMVLPEEPIAHEGRPGVIRARAEEAARTVQHAAEADKP